MSKTSKKTYEEIQQRKERLKDELESIEDKYSERIQKIRKTIGKGMQPVSTIRKKPFKAVGYAVIMGFAAGLAGRRNRTRKTSEISGSSGLRFSSLLIDELKRLAASKAMFYLSDFIDQKISEKKGNSGHG